MENNQIRKEILRTISELRYKGYKTDTFFDGPSEIDDVDEETYKELLFVASTNVMEKLLDAAYDGLDDSYLSYLVYTIVEENVIDKAVDLVEESIEDLFFN